MTQLSTSVGFDSRTLMAFTKSGEVFSFDDRDYLFTFTSASSGYVVIQLSTSVGSDGHTMALTESGEEFSWGHGDYLFIIYHSFYLPLHLLHQVML